MSILFEPIQLAHLQIKNRFVCSATYEGMATETGMVTEKIVKRYRNLAKGDVGLIITGYMYVHPPGRAVKYQTGIYNDDTIPGLTDLVRAVHREGITPLLAKQYAQWLSELGIDGLEISCGTPIYSFMNMCRGHVPVKEILEGLSRWKKPVGKRVLTALPGKYDLQEGYNLEAAKKIKPVIGKVPLFLVGGLRSLSYMEEILEKGYVDFISMSRPFIRESFLVKRFKDGKSEVVSCVSCNKCLAAVANNMPVRCYN